MSLRGGGGSFGRGGRDESFQFVQIRGGGGGGVGGVGGSRMCRCCGCCRRRRLFPFSFFS